MKKLIGASISGLLFGFGLALSEMIDPKRVRGFLDVTGDWDPTLVFVLAGAVTVTLISFRFILRSAKPVCTPKFNTPTNTRIDRRLIIGALLFGIGWGISGYCPGPGLAALSHASINALVFVVALIAGSLLCRTLTR